MEYHHFILCNAGKFIIININIMQKEGKFINMNFFNKNYVIVVAFLFEIYRQNLRIKLSGE